jgi:hypothetical protein
MEYLNLYYLSDDDVTGDYELQNWAKQLSGALDSSAGRAARLPRVNREP